MILCEKCGTQVDNGARFCRKCGNPVANAPSVQVNPTRRINQYAGVVRKCPACGAAVDSMTASCKMCGQVFTNLSVASSVQTFANGIQQFDNTIALQGEAKNGYSSWSQGGKAGWIVANVMLGCLPLLVYAIYKAFTLKSKPKMHPAEQQKEAYISGYVFPNDKESLSEALIYIMAQIDNLMRVKLTRKSIFWINQWIAKAEQVGEKISIVQIDDPVLIQMKNKVKETKEILNKKVMIIRALLIAAVCVFWIVFRIIPQSTKNNNTQSGTVVEDMKHESEWPSEGLAVLLPEITNNTVTIRYDDPEKVWMEVKRYSRDDFKNYVEECKFLGFDNIEKDYTTEFIAMNKDGIRLELTYSYSPSDPDLTIKIYNKE